MSISRFVVVGRKPSTTQAEEGVVCVVVLYDRESQSDHSVDEIAEVGEIAGAMAHMEMHQLGIEEGCLQAGW
jgi:hypothetical protein